MHDSESFPALLQREGIDVTMLTDWFELNKHDPVARTLMLKIQLCERYYLRMLLNVVRRVEGFEELMTVNNRICPTFKQACFAYGLLNDNKEWTKAISEASLWLLRPQLQDIFITMLLFCDLTDVQIRNYCLLEIQDLLHRYGRSLEDFKDLPRPDPSLLTNMDNRLIRKALDFDIKKQDKSPMTQRYAFEALDITLRDILGLKCPEKKKQAFWWHDRFVRRRLQANPSSHPKGKKTRDIKVKEGEDEPTWIEILERFLIKEWDTPIQQIVAETYPDFTSMQTDKEY
ncbi:hypothetical protein Tco_0708657 [Tanacetum coccineum]